MATYSTRPDHQSDIPFEFENTRNYDDRSKRQPLAFSQDEFDEDDQEPSEPRRRDSTITASEQAIFTRIFNNLVRSSTESMPAGEEDEYDFPGGEEEEESTEDLSSIFGAAVEAARTKANRKEKREAFHSLGEMRKFWVTRYPEPLREAADKASGIVAKRELRIRRKLSEVRQQPMPGHQNTLFERKVQKERQAQLRKVETLLRSAETDFQLWDVLEKEVFSTIKKIEAEAPPRITRQTPHKRKPGRPKKGVEPDSPVIIDMPITTTDAEKKTKDKIPALSIVGPNYPSHCLLALRLLHDNFPTSPLALCLLPAIKRLGPTSYVLGASTALYNELISIQWLVYNDMRAMADLLTEMDEQDVNFSEETVKLLKLPAWDRSAAKSGTAGRSLGVLWEMEEMEAAFARLTALRRVVFARVDKQRREKAMDALRRTDEDLEDTLVPAAAASAQILDR
ncbi:hypothetical protein MMC16_001392 [Acarospora aff. strigata]|nr:hypothetical protein [Acarospora aff. strigata]